MDNYRAVIEVLKWSNPKDTLKTASIVDKRWQEVSDSEELWRHFLPPDSDPQGTTSKLYFLQNFTSSVFVVLSAKLLRCYVKQGTWSEQPLSRRIAINTSMSVTRISEDSLLVIGGKSANSNTLKVDIHTGEVQVLPELSPHRSWIGVISIEKITYAFCGETSDGTKLQSCNTFSLAALAWTKIHKAGQKRSRFTPCATEKCIYLLGSSSEDPLPCEVYYRLSGEFHPVQFSLPYDSSVSIVHNGSFLVISPDKVFTKPVGSAKLGQTTTLKKTLFADVSSGYDPLVCGNYLYFLQREFSRVVKFALDTNTWTSYGYKGEKTHYHLKR